MVASTSTAVPFAQGRDVARLRAVVNMSTKEVKDYAKQYEDQRVIVEALGHVAQADPANKLKLDILKPRERRLETARDRETAAMSNLTNCLIADSSVVHARAAATVATTIPIVSAITPLSISTTEKKIIKRKLPEPCDG